MEITQKEFDQLSEFIKKNYGIYLKDSKKTLLTGRLFGVLQEKNLKNFSEYYNYLVADKTGEAVSTLLDKITTNHTFFMREADHFYFFRDKVLPYMAETIRNKDLRTWCAACSSGEEAYTLAMIIDEFFGVSANMWDTKILATDISSNILTAAKKGVYSNERIQPLPPVWKMNYFRKLDNENSVVSDKIKNQILFRKFNLVEDYFPFKKKFHVIFCRNVMLYFDDKTKDELVEKFYDFTEDGGYLFIGHTESINRDKTRYKYIMPSVYRKM